MSYRTRADGYQIQMNDEFMVIMNYHDRHRGRCNTKAFQNRFLDITIIIIYYLI